MRGVRQQHRVATAMATTSVDLAGEVKHSIELAEAQRNEKLARKKRKRGDDGEEEEGEDEDEDDDDDAGDASEEPAARNAL